MRISLDLEEVEVFWLVVEDTRSGAAQDYRDWLLDCDLTEEAGDKTLYRWCYDVVTDFLNESPQHQAGDNLQNMVAVVYNIMQEYFEAEAERESSRRNE